MAVYKVPQDVEADDKLIGPFSFRQFIYLLIVGAAIALGWGLSRVFVPLAILPLPVVIFFGALALPLRKDQPMEVYLAALVSFYIKPRKRLWQPDGITSLIEVSAPKKVEASRTKGFDETEAERRLSYLAGIVDSQGWAVRGVPDNSHNSAMNSDVFFEAQQTEDVLDDDNSLSKNFDTMISQADQNRRKEMVKKMQESYLPGPQFNDQHFDRPPEAPTAPNPFLTNDDVTPASMHYDPYPDSIRQAVIQPLSEQNKTEPQTQPQAPQNQQLPPAVTTPQTQAASQPAPVDPSVYTVPEQPAAQPAPAPVNQTPTPPEVRYTQPTAPIYRRPEPQQAPEPPAPVQNSSPEPPSPDTIDLAINHHDLSVETISREANRIRQKKEQTLGEEEVVISLR